MNIHKIVEGVGFGCGGPDANYIKFINESGGESCISATELIPSDGVAYWAHIDALIGGFGKTSSEKKLATKFANEPKPRAYRMKITVEVEPLSDEENEALLVKAREHNSDLFDDGR